MNGSWILVVEMITLALVLGFSVWVLVVQPIALIRTMERRKFVGLQMRVVRIWINVLVPLTALVLVAAIVRAGISPHAIPAAAALLAALLASLWVLPRAFRAGGQALRADEDETLTSTSFLSQGGGKATHVWHRVMLLLFVVVLGGSAADGACAMAWWQHPHAGAAQPSANTQPNARTARHHQQRLTGSLPSFPAGDHRGVIAVEACADRP